jgi:hypothetical protein
MPLYYYECSKCSWHYRKIQTPEEAEKTQICRAKGCTAELVRKPVAPSARVTEVIDNGIMPRRLERLADAERLFAERNEAVKKQQGE